MIKDVVRAAAMGAGIGVVLAMALFDQRSLLCILAGGLLGALAGSICYCPREIVQKVAGAFASWKNDKVIAFSSGGLLLPARNAAQHLLEKIASAAKVVWSKVPAIVKTVYALSVIATFVVVARFTTGYLFLKLGLYSKPGEEWALSFAGNLICFCGCLYIVLQLGCKNKSWYMPMLIRLTAPLERWVDRGATKEHFGWREYIGIWAFVALVGPISPIIMAIFVILLPIDLIATIIFAVASTARLAAMLGAFIGAVAGMICSASAPAIIIACIVGGASGGAIYKLRCRLVLPQPT